MARTTGRDAPEFTRSLTSLVALGAEFGIAPDADQGTEHPNAEVSPETSSLAATMHLDTVEPDGVARGGGQPPDPAILLARVKSLGASLAARHERDRDERAGALRELAGYDAQLGEIRALEASLGDATAVRAGFEGLLATPFGDPAWIYDQTLRDDYAQAVAEARAAEAAFATLIADKRRGAERLAAQPQLARLLAERRRHEEGTRAKENAAEANRQRSLALASAVKLRDAGSLVEARRVLGPVCDKFPDDPEARSVLSRACPQLW